MRGIQLERIYVTCHISFLVTCEGRNGCLHEALWLADFAREGGLVSERLRPIRGLNQLQNRPGERVAAFKLANPSLSLGKRAESGYCCQYAGSCFPAE